MYSYSVVGVLLHNLIPWLCVAELGRFTYIVHEDSDRDFICGVFDPHGVASTNYSNGALRYSNVALMYTNSALTCNTGALKYSNCALSYTNGALRYIE